jgi:hypothetical protein
MVSKISRKGKMMSQQLGLQLNPDLAWRMVDDEVLIVNIKTGHYFALNEVASKIWVALQAGQLPQQVADQLSQIYGIDAQVINTDISELLAELKTENILN